jgi:hypothetical protein
LVINAWVNCKTAFNGSSPTFTLGTGISATSLFESSDVGLGYVGASAAGSGGNRFNPLYFPTHDTLDVALNPDSSSDGEAEVLIEYLPPPSAYEV